MTCHSEIRLFLCAMLLFCTEATGAGQDAISDTVRTMLVEGNRHFSENDYDSAAQEYSRVLETKPDCYTALFNRGVVSFVLGNLEGASEDFARASISNPKNRRALFAKCAVLLSQWRFKEASTCLSSTISSVNTNAPDSLLLSWFNVNGHPEPNTLPYFYDLSPGNKWSYRVTQNLERRRFETSSEYSGRTVIFSGYVEVVSPCSSLVGYEVQQLGEGLEKFVTISSWGTQIPYYVPIEGAGSEQSVIPKYCQLYWKIPRADSLGALGEFQEVALTFTPRKAEQRWIRPILYTGFGKTITMRDTMRIWLGQRPFYVRRSQFAASSLNPFSQSDETVDLWAVYKPFCVDLHGEGTLGILRPPRDTSCNTMGTEFSDPEVWSFSRLTTGTECFEIEKPSDTVVVEAGSFSDCIKCTHMFPSVYYPGCFHQTALLKSVSFFCRGVGLVKESQFDINGNIMFERELVEYVVRK